MAAETPAGPSPASDFLMYKFSRSGLSGPSTEKKASGYDVATVWAKGVFPLPSGPYSRISAGERCGTGSENGRVFQMKSRCQRWTGRIRVNINGVLMQLTKIWMSAAAAASPRPTIAATIDTSSRSGNRSSRSRDQLATWRRVVLLHCQHASVFALNKLLHKLINFSEYIF